ncbi:MAG: hypothetical protein EXS05_10425 [Planctomycetaceae bacterium]|nr:hypothetical protein [Planctomycetaceae bacterium]
MPRCLRSGMKAALIVVLLTGLTAAAEKHAGLDQTGKPDLKSAGPLVFGPEGVLFVGDTQGAAVFAIGVEPATGGAPAADFRFEGLDTKLAALLGIKAADLLINDLAVQPGSGVIYVSASRGKGPDAEPVLARITPTGNLSVLTLDKVPFAKAALKNAPAADAKDRRGNSLRQESITDLQYVDGRVFVAGLSNEEFDSSLRAIAFPFASDGQTTSIEIYHGAHGKFETKSPVRTFTPFVINGEPHLLAAYTCTPLVTIPVADLKAGAKLRGTTVAELGNMNRPLDIIAYEKDGRQFLLMANSARGVMKITTDTIAKQAGITEPIKGTAGLSYETLSALKGVEQLDKLGDKAIVLLVRADDKSLNLESIPLP